MSAATVLRSLDEKELEVFFEQFSAARATKKFAAVAIPFTPLPLIKEIFEKVPMIHSKNLDINIAVMYTVEMAAYLCWLGFKNITIITAENDDNIKRFAVAHEISYEVLPLEKEWNMKFDVVCGNPPYQEGNTGTNKTFYHKFYYKGLSLLAEDGTLVFVSPTTWMKSTKPLLQKLHQTLKTNGLYDITPLDPLKVFGITVDSLGVVWVNKKSNSRLTLDSKDILLTRLMSKSVSGNTLLPQRGTTRQLTKKGELTQNGRGVVSFTNTNQFKIKTINRVSDGAGKPEISWCDVVVDNNNDTPRVVYGIISTNKGIGPTHLIVDQENITQMCCYISVADEQEGNNLIQYMQSKVFSFMLNELRPNTTNSLGIIRRIPAVDLSRSWTDAELYTHFNLTEEEIALIESTIK